MYKPILALNCRFQIEHVNSVCAETDNGSLALAFRSLRFLSASQILFSSTVNSAVNCIITKEFYE